MSKTVEELVSWVQSQDAIRTVLVEVDDVTGSGSSTIYLSSKPYTTEVGETPSGVSYDPCIAGSLSFQEGISLDLTPSIGYGNIELANHDGSKDTWLNWTWTNRTIRVYTGDPRWPRDDFYLIFTGVINDIVPGGTSTLNLVVLNKIDRLNNPISEKTLGSLYPTVADGGVQGNESKPVGALQNRDSILPLCFGECFNVTPLLISSALTGGTTNTLTYMVHDGPIQEIIEIRDNGVPIYEHTVNLSTGTFTLNKAPAGTITCQVRGSTLGGTYSTVASDIIKYIALTYGPSNSRFTQNDIDLGNFILAQARSAPVGIYITDRENVLDICSKLAASVGGVVTTNLPGKLQMRFLEIPGVTVPTGVISDITYDNTLHNSLNISSKPIVRGSVKLAYCYNWAPQPSGLAGSVPQASQDIYSKDWLYIIQKDDTVIAEHRLDVQPVPEETYLLRQEDAIYEAQRRLALWKEKRIIVSVAGTPELIAIEPGSAVTVTGHRYGLSITKPGVLISVSKNWFTYLTELEVLI